MMEMSQNIIFVVNVMFCGIFYDKDSVRFYVRLFRSQDFAIGHSIYGIRIRTKGVPHGRCKCSGYDWKRFV